MYSTRHLKILLVFVVITTIIVAILYYQERALVPPSESVGEGVGQTPSSSAEVGVDDFTYFGNQATGDLNADGTPDSAFLVYQEGGGSGTFFYLIAKIKTVQGEFATNEIFIGDRIAPQTTEIRDGTIVVNYADRQSGEPMSSAPTLGVSRYFAVVSGELVELE